MLTVGIPKEQKIREYRVALTPEGAEVLTRRGISVLIERGAGSAAGFSDSDYVKAGARIADSAEALWHEAGVIQKVKEPIEAEYPYLSRDKILFGFLHLASKTQCTLLKALVDSGITAIGYETVDIKGYTPLLKPMSIAAGTLAAYYAGVYKNLAEISDGKVKLSATTDAIVRKLLDHFPDTPVGFPPGKVVVLGGGQAGLAAAQTSAHMRGRVVVTELNARRRQYLTVYASDHNIPLTVLDAAGNYDDFLYDSDVIIATVHQPGTRAPEIISEDLLKEISRGHSKIIIDISIDQGGNIAQSRPTTYEDPLYVDAYGNIRFAVTNMPSACPKKVSRMLEHATLDYTIALSKGLETALAEYPELKGAVNVQGGKVRHKAVALAHQVALDRD